MKKRWEVFWLAEAGIILIYILLCLAAGRVLIAAGAAAARPSQSGGACITSRLITP